MYRLIMVDERYNWELQKIELHTRIAKTGIPTMQEAIALRKKYDNLNTNTVFMVEEDDQKTTHNELEDVLNKALVHAVKKITDKF